MTYTPNRHHRRSIRLQGYGDALAGAYFVTIFVQDRVCLLGEAVKGEVLPTDAGRMVRRWGDGVPNAFAGTETDAFVLMPNHAPGIVLLGTNSLVEQSEVQANAETRGLAS